MSKSTIGIAFNHGGIIPAAILGLQADKHLAPHEAIEVPERYGRHLIEDRFAYAKVVGTPVKADGKKAKLPKTSDDKSVAAAVSVAEQAVDDATRLLSEAGDDLVKKGEAQAALAAATAALGKLKAE